MQTEARLAPGTGASRIQESKGKKWEGDRGGPEAGDRKRRIAHAGETGDRGRGTRKGEDAGVNLEKKSHCGHR